MAVMTLPTFRPMLAGVGVPRADGWVFEPKWDGWRALVYVDDGTVRVRTRSGRSVTDSLPELAPLGAVGRRMVLDGELVAARDGRMDFWSLAGRMAARRPVAVARACQAVSVAFVAFDILWLDEDDLTGRPHSERRAALEAIELPGPAVTVTPSHADGDALFAFAEEHGLEGIVAKRLDSVYRPGKRSTAWLKRKTPAWKRDEAPYRHKH